MALDNTPAGARTSDGGSPHAAIWLYPGWVIRRLRRLNLRFATGAEEPLMPLVRRHYSAMGGGDSMHLLPLHLEWIARAWLVCGPHVPPPRVRDIPAVVDILDRLGREDALLEGWLIVFLGQSLRGGEWRITPAQCEFASLLRSRSVRRYWEWLIGAVKSLCTAEPQSGNWHDDVLAARVIARLFGDAGLQKLARCIRRWEAAKCPVDEVGAESLPPRQGRAATWRYPLLDGSAGVSRGGVVVRHLGTARALTGEGNLMHNCAGKLFGQVEARQLLVLSLRHGRCSRSTLTLNVASGGRWHINEIKGIHNRCLAKTHPHMRAAQQLCIELDGIGSRHPLLGEYLAASTASRRNRERHGRYTADPRRLRLYVPGIGRQHPHDVLRRLWSASRGVG